MDNELLTLKGKIVKVIYDSGDFGVAVFYSKGQRITITGSFSQLAVNHEYEISGSYVTHPRYGFQFRVVSIKMPMPGEEEDIINFMKSEFAGIGKKTARKIVSLYGKDTLNILSTDAKLIDELPITDRQKQSIQAGLLRLNDPDEKLRLALLSAGFNLKEINLIHNTYGPKLNDILDDNPYRLFYDINGLGFKRVDSLALSGNIKQDDLRRRSALLMAKLIDLSFESGNTKIDIADLSQAYRPEGFLLDEDVLSQVISQKYAQLEGNEIYTYKEWLDEEFIASFLASFVTENDCDVKLLERAIQDRENKDGISYSAKQKEAIINFFNNSFSLITGGPGTGKTTIVKALVDILRNQHPYISIAIIAPTGRAAKRIAELCLIEARTIHSFLKWDKDSNTFTYNENNPVLYDVLIIDEFSMVDNNLFASILKASKTIKKICLIGDDAQLPSIRPGNVLKDLLHTNLFKHTHLDANYRQKKDNEIIKLADDILKGEINFNDYSKDVIFIERDNYDLNILLNLAEELNQQGYGLDDIQVLSSMYKGPYGVDYVNEFLRNYYNPPALDKNEIRFRGRLFREGDKVIQLKNQASDDIFNGDIGIIAGIDIKEKSAIVDFSGITVFYTYDELETLSLAYAITVHKAQGSEYPCIFFLISKGQVRMLEKKLIYTASTRAKQKLYIIGSKELFADSIKKERSARKTGLLAKCLLAFESI